MANRVCWHCDVKTHMTMVDNSQRAVMVEGKDETWAVFGTFACDECRWHSIAVSIIKSRYSLSAQEMVDQLNENAHHWEPAHGSSKTYDDVPSHISAPASEAHACHSINAYRAATLMARSVIEATAKEKGVTTGTLFQKIDALAAQGLLRAVVQDAAHEVRLFGNDMAHGDFEQDVTAEESAEVLGLMAEVLDEVFQSPTRLARRKANREAKKNSGT